MNPVLAREAKQRFRGRRAGATILFWVGLLGALTFLLYIASREVAINRFGVGQLAATAFMGRFMFHSIALLLLTAVILVVPAIAAPSIVGERERQTFQILQVTQMGPWQLVLGKLAASMAFAMILLIAVVPIAAIPLLFGGASVGDVLAVVAMLVLTSLTLASVATWTSSRAASTRGSVMGAYAVAFSLAFLSFVSLGAEFLAIELLADGGVNANQDREWISALPNPYFGLVSAVEHPLGAGSAGDTIFAPFQALLHLRQGDSLDNFGVGGVVGEPIDLKRPPVWIYTTVIYLGITGLSLWRASMNVRAPSTHIKRVKRHKGDDG
ncbi:MAG: ABC transporter permease [Acidimicrobiia bacterium]